jgi:RNA polymerase sigma factor (sigma-70 family)
MVDCRDAAATQFTAFQFARTFGNVGARVVNSAGRPLCAATESSAGVESPSSVCGDTGAINDVYRAHHPALLRFLRARTGSLDEARDVAQEAFRKLLELERLDDVSFLAGFLWKTAQNIVIDRQRHRANRRRLDPIALFEPTKQFPSPESWLDAQQRLKIIDRAIDRLTPMCRSVFVLRIMHERAPDEVAAELGISTRLVRQLAARGLEYVQSVMAEAETDGKERP